MGMFDHVDFKTNCPKCDEPVTDFQSKSGSCTMKTLKITDLSDGDTFYSKCESCGAWIEGVLHVRIKVVAVNLEVRNA